MTSCRNATVYLSFDNDFCPYICIEINQSFKVCLEDNTVYIFDELMHQEKMTV